MMQINFDTYPSDDYYDLRQTAVRQNNDRTNPPGICEPGNAECCDDHPPVIQDDIRIIMQAVQLGAISIDVIKDAYKKSLDSNRASCVFLVDSVDEEGITMRLCSINSFKPIICIANDGSNPSGENAIRYERRERLEQQFVQDGMANAMCKSCFKKNVSLRKGKLENMEEAITLIRYSKMQFNEAQHLIDDSKPFSYQAVLDAFNKLFTTRDIPRLILIELGLLDENGNVVEEI